MKPIGPERVAFRGKLIEIIHQEYELPNGVKTFEYARRGPGTRILVVRSDHSILLTREFRRETGGYDVRLPGGKVFDTLVEYEKAITDKAPIFELASEAAARELLEETGITAKRLSFEGISKCGATVEWDLYYFLCTDWTPAPSDFSPDEDEDITVNWTAFEEAREFCLDGTISEERSAVRILRYLHGVEGVPK